MTDFERFDVVTALFPFVDIAIRKPGPALVLAAAAFNARHGHLVAAMITTGAGSHWPSDQPIVDLGAAGLKHRSVVRWTLFTLPFSAIGLRIGALGSCRSHRLRGSVVGDPGGTLDVKRPAPYRPLETH